MVSISLPPRRTLVLMTGGPVSASAFAYALTRPSVVPFSLFVSYEYNLENKLAIEATERLVACMDRNPTELPQNMVSLITGLEPTTLNLLTIAFNEARRLRCDTIITGHNLATRSTSCSPTFFARFQMLENAADGSKPGEGIQLIAPFMGANFEFAMELAKELNVYETIKKHAIWPTQF